MTIYLSSVNNGYAGKYKSEFYNTLNSYITDDENSAVDSKYLFDGSSRLYDTGNSGI